MYFVDHTKGIEMLQKKSHHRIKNQQLDDIIHPVVLTMTDHLVHHHMENDDDIDHPVQVDQIMIIVIVVIIDAEGDVVHP